MNVKTVFSIFILILSLTGICFSQNVDLRNNFSDPQYGYTIKYPDGWQAKIHRSGIVLADLNTLDNSAGLQIRQVSINQQPDIFLKQYKDSFVNDMKAYMISEERVIINGVDAYSMSFESGRTGKSYFLKSYIIPVSREKVFIFQAGAPWDSRFDITPVLDAIAFSFKF